MLYLIHGDHTEPARQKLLDLKEQAAGKTIRELNGKKLEQSMLIQALESSSLFGGDVCVVIEGFLSNAKKREKSFASTLAHILDAAATVDIICYEEKEIDAPTVAKLGAQASVFLFKTPVLIFQFLDNVRPGNAATSLDTLQRVVAREAPEIVYTLLVRRVRQLIQLLDRVTPEGLQSWQATRLTSQARHFTMEQLVAMHKSLLEIDIAIKTGTTPFSLTQLLEQYIIQL